MCQRIGIAQPEFFGLRYLVKNTENEYRWIELERPLNRQLEKYATNTKILSLRVMYYVISGISLITDEVTRNYYFMQLKNDVVDGKLICDVDKVRFITKNYLKSINLLLGFFNEFSMLRKITR